MKEFNKIDALNEKYWAGETSLEEERYIKEYFLNNPQDNTPEQAYFSFLKEEKARTYTGVVQMPRSRVTTLVRRLLPIAASLILLAAAMWTFNTQTVNKNETVIDDPQVALQITREAFALLNGKIGQGEQVMRDNIVHLEKTLIFKNL